MLGLQKTIDEQIRLNETQAQDYRKALDGLKVEYAREITTLKNNNTTMV